MNLVKMLNAYDGEIGVVLAAGAIGDLALDYEAIDRYNAERGWDGSDYIATDDGQAAEYAGGRWWYVGYAIDYSPNA